MLANVLEKPATVENSLHEVSKIGSRVTDAVEDGVRSASQAIRRGRHAAEDAIEEAKHTVKQRPLQAMGTVFAAGVLTGTFIYVDQIPSSLSTRKTRVFWGRYPPSGLLFQEEWNGAINSGSSTASKKPE